MVAMVFASSFIQWLYCWLLVSTMLRVLAAVNASNGKFGTLVIYYTLCSEKNTHSRFLLHFLRKCLDLHKIFRVCFTRS